MYVTLGRQLKSLAPLTARSALEKFAAVYRVDVRIPTTDRRELLLTGYTQPEPELELLLERLRLTLPAHPPPKISAAQTESASLILARIFSSMQDRRRGISVWSRPTRIRAKER